MIRVEDQFVSGNRTFTAGFQVQKAAAVAAIFDIPGSHCQGAISFNLVAVSDVCTISCIQRHIIVRIKQTIIKNTVVCADAGIVPIYCGPVA